MPEVRSELENFEPIGLELMDRNELTDRLDYKYIFHSSRIPELLQGLGAEYQILTVAGNILQNYRTFYFDTPGFCLFHLHQRNKSNRIKVRIRNYTESGISFFEIKGKEKGNRTCKQRINIENIRKALTVEEKSMIRLEGINSDEMEFKLEFNFKRITLTSRYRQERITLDYDIKFNDGEQNYDLRNVAIIEVKCNKESGLSPIQQRLREMRITSSGFSKYATGVAMSRQIRSNKFKPKLLLIEKLMSLN